MGAETERHIPINYDNRGNPCWGSVMTPPDNSIAVCHMVPDRVIPVIFVPGVMGSNLIQKKTEPDKAIKWRMDSPGTAAEWARPTRGATFRKRYLTPTIMEVDRNGVVPTDMPLPAEELRRRGWGEVGALSYAPFLTWLEHALNDFDSPKTGERSGLMSLDLQALLGENQLSRDEVGLSYRYRFPVHACGYNWLDDNANSAELLAKRIDAIKARYTKEKKKCDKVIVVTHSMGGLVARHCSEVLNRRDDIFGIVHGVMPAIGAAAVYRRCKAGTEDPTAWYNAVGAVTAAALGNDAAEMTAVLSSAPGPMQLLPTPEYGNGWLKIKDGSKEYSLPKNGDPYGEIYTVRGKWWSMCEDHLINPLNDAYDANKRRVQTDKDWDEYTKLIKKVKNFHSDIKDKYHRNTHAFFGAHTDQKAYGTVVWTGDGGGWLRGDRAADVLNAQALDQSEISRRRTVAAPLKGSGWLQRERQAYKISEPDEAGDGTVPHRSGVAPKAHCQSFLQVNVGHEPAYKHGEGTDNLRACRFTLRAIVRIAQNVQQTSLSYE